MKNLLLLLSCEIVTSCDQPVEKLRDVPAPETVEVGKPNTESESRQLQGNGYQTFMFKEGDPAYLMQQYYIAFLKTDKNKSQDSIETASIQQEHLPHLSRM